MNIKTIKTNGKKVCIVQIPENVTYTPSIVGNSNYKALRSITSEGGWWHSDNLPPGNWRILGLSNELSEEQMKEVLPTIINGKKPMYKHLFTSFLSDNKIEGNVLILIEN